MGREVLGLGLAVGFAVSLNLALVGSFIWTESVQGVMLQGMWGLSGAIWMAAAVGTAWWLGMRHPARFAQQIDLLYREGLQEYIQGRWQEARERFERIVQTDSTDADALMQLGMIFTHTGQPVQARRAFRQCLELDREHKWRWEIRHELARLGDG